MRWPLRKYNYYARHIFVALCLVVLAVESHAQRLADSLSFECRSCKAEQLIKTFSQQHSTTFSYNPEIFDKDSLYSIQQKHLTLQQWLDMLSDALGVSYDVLHEQVVLYLPATSYKPIYE